jgi:hypothetical protein
MEDWFQEGHRPMKILIRADYRGEMIVELFHYGISRRDLFPDLDGLAMHLNWINRRRERWVEERSTDDV